MPLRHILLALLVVAIWGLNFVFIKWGVEQMPPLLLTALRYICAVLPAVFFVKRPQVRLSILLVYGLAIGFAQFGLLFSAIKLGMPAGLASLLMQLQVFFTVALAIMFLGEKLSRFQAVGGLVAMAGVAVIAIERVEITALVPLAMIIAAAFFWGVANIASKKAGQIDMLSFVVWGSLVPIVPLLGLSLVLDGPTAMVDALVNISGRSIFVVVFNAYAATLLGFGLWSYLLKLHPAGLIAPFSLLVPVAGIASAMLILGEAITPLEIVGSIVIFAGLVWSVFGARLQARTRAR